MGTGLKRYTTAALTDRGRKRPGNEDAFGVSAEHGVYLVCDGMGGAAAGEVASGMAVDETMRALSAHAGLVSPERAEQAILAANEAILQRAQQNPKLTGMGTTLVALVANEEHVWMLNVGDSRGYRLRNKRLEQITRDHSLVDEQVRLGQMSRAEAERSPLRNVITRALGTQGNVTPDTFTLVPEPGDLFLLCSDGLTRELADAQIESILSADLPLEDLCAGLIRAANNAGGNDNITCLLVRAQT